MDWHKGLYVGKEHACDTTATAIAIMEGIVVIVKVTFIQYYLRLGTILSTFFGQHPAGSYLENTFITFFLWNFTGMNDSSTLSGPLLGWPCFLFHLTSLSSCILSSDITQYFQQPPEGLIFNIISILHLMIVSHKEIAQDSMLKAWGHQNWNPYVLTMKNVIFML